MPRIFAAILLVAVLAVGGGIIATTAYQAGVSTAVTTATARRRHGRRPRRRPRLRLRLRLVAPVRLRVLRVLRDAVLPVHRVRPDPRHLLARRPARRLGPGLGRLVLDGPNGGARARAAQRLGVPRPRHLRRLASPGPSARRRPTAGTGSRRRRPDPAAPPRTPTPPARSARPDRASPLPAPPDASSGGAPSSRSAPQPLYDARPMKTILVVDDEPKIVQLARDYLEHAGFAVLTAGDGPAALATVRQRRPDLVVLDLGLPGPRRPRRHPRAPARLDDPDRDAHGPRRRARQAARARARRRRLPHQAVQPARARRPRPGGPAPGRATARGAPRPSAPATSSSTCPGCGPRWPAGRRADADRVPAPGDAGRPARAGSSPGPSCSTRSTASRSRRTSGRSIRTSRTCAASSSPTRAGRATS